MVSKDHADGRPFNGPPREMGELSDDQRVYCSQCGTIYVPNHNRDCPACTLAEMLETALSRIEPNES